MYNSLIDFVKPNRLHQLNLFYESNDKTTLGYSHSIFIQLKSYELGNQFMMALHSFIVSGDRRSESRITRRLLEAVHCDIYNFF